MGNPVDRPARVARRAYMFDFIAPDDAVWERRVEELMQEPDYDAIFSQFDRTDLIEFIADLHENRSDGHFRLQDRIEKWAQDKANQEASEWADEYA